MPTFRRRLVPTAAPLRGAALVRKLGCALALAAGAPAAHADPPRPKSYALGWVRLEGAEACIGPRELGASVEELLGRRVLAPAGQADRQIEGRVGARPGGWRVTLRLANAQGAFLARRELAADGPDCRALDEKLKLTLALLTSPGADSAPLPAGWALSPAEPDPWENLPDHASAIDEVDPWRGLPASDPDPWQGLPPAASRGAASQRGGARRDGFEGAEIGAFVGYGTGSSVVPLEGVSTPSGLGLGVGLRGGYQFASGWWLGASYTHYAGGTFEAEGPVLGSRGFSGATARVEGRFTTHAPALEVGYTFDAGPLRLRPLLGVGAAFYDFETRASTGRPGSIVLLPGAITRDGGASSFAAWPGLSLAVPIDGAFFGAEARWALLGGADASAPLSFFGVGGVRFLVHAAARPRRRARSGPTPDPLRELENRAHLREARDDPERAALVGDRVEQAQRHVRPEGRVDAHRLRRARQGPAGFVGVGR